ncbi:hypothetical protein SAMN04488570_1367 [Nocardioides scoriae]|uniref:Uncharacterized protein n=1 Tax=Nocardioides scoriae TaxID=642780 RepID=A0A1H1QBC2_9ACTN|nr:hypothetical protein [Nocardioides scoriae]SDS20725.1 hypothetical protein SAMN04488570_1367 [Nocardioides scoriae]
MSSSGEAAEVEANELSPFVADIVEAYGQFAGLQQQKLRMVKFVAGREAEIDDPVATTSAILRERYTHVDGDKIDAVLNEVSQHLTVKKGTGGADPTVAVTDQIEEVMQRCLSILPAHYVSTCFLEFLQQSLEAARRPGQARDFRTSVFASMIADFEALMVNVATRMYSENPLALSAKERAVAWSEIFKLVDIDDFREQLIDEAVVDLMRGSFSDWMSTLKRDHGIDLAKYASSPQIIEVFQRRHVLMHNGGIVSSLYLRNCPKVTAQRGDRLDVTDDYFAQSADLLSVVALALSVQALFKYSNEERVQTELRMADWVYQLLLRRRYGAVHDYLVEVPFDRMASLSSKEICRINMWLALKRLGRFDECRSEVEAWQVGHLEDRFKLARHCLLGEVEEAAQLCAEMRTNGSLPLKHWAEWPILEEVREYEAERPDDPVIPEVPALEPEPELDGPNGLAGEHDSHP